MGWEERRYEPTDSGGRFRTVLRRIFGDGENPLDWAIPLYTAWRIRVKIHIAFVIMIAIELIESVSPSGLGPGHKAMSMACLFGLVLLHEYGHCIACRRVGGTADQILMWPLGGLASCSPPPSWRAQLITVLGGPAVNLLLWPLFAAALIALGQGWGSVWFNPFDPRQAVGALHATNNSMLRVVWWIWWLYYTNAFLFVFNMALPMYPMDGARTFQVLYARKVGYNRATLVTTTIGLVTAIVLAAVAFTVKDQQRLFGLAFFGGIMCYLERRRLAMVDDHPALAGDDFERGYKGLPPEEEESEKQRNKRRRKEEEDQQELDRILAKIAATGMGSLTRGEKKWLEEASARRRGG